MWPDRTPMENSLSKNVGCTLQLVCTLTCFSLFAMLLLRLAV